MIATQKREQNNNGQKSNVMEIPKGIFEKLNRPKRNQRQVSGRRSRPIRIMN